MTDGSLRLEILSAATEPGGQSPNEDRYGVNLATGYAWVLDGATSTAPPRITADQTDGAWFADRIDAALDAMAASPEQPLPGDMLTRAVESVRAELEKLGLDPDDRPPYASVALVALRDRVLHYAVLGDVALIVGASAHDEPLVIRDRRSDLFVAQAIDLTYRFQGDELLSEQRAFEARYVNTANGYPILSTSTAAAARAVTGAIAVEGGARLLMISDGVTRLVDLFEQPPDMPTLLEHVSATSDGAARTIAEVRSLERQDEDRRRVRRIKAHDDATALCLGILG